VDGSLCDEEESHYEQVYCRRTTFGWTTRRLTGGKRFPCYRNIIQINITTETCTRVILAGTHTDAATGAAPGPLAGSRCRQPINIRVVYLSISVCLSPSPSLSLSLSLSHYLCLSHTKILTPVSGSAPVFLPEFLYYFIVYAHYYYYCFLGKRPRDEWWRAGHDVPSSSCTVPNRTSAR